MDFFYDGQVRRYVTQFMRFFIGFKYKSGDGEERHVPVTYGDLTRQVASIIRDNSENKMPTVPRIACYITGLELDTSRLSDPSFVSKVHIRERAYTNENGVVEYANHQGGSYTVERLHPTPYKLKLKADLWTSNTDQKLQLLEQILVFFNPSFEIQTTDNYIDWTSLTTVTLDTVNFSSRTIPQGTDTDIDVCSLEFTTPIYISTPAKVKKLGIVQNIKFNIFDSTGELLDLNDLLIDLNASNTLGGHGNTYDKYGVLLLKSNNGNANDYDVSILDVSEAVSATGLEAPAKSGPRIDWYKILDLYGNYRPGVSKIYFRQPDGLELQGRFTINEVDTTYLVVTIEDRPSNTTIYSSVYPAGRTTIDAIVDPYKFNPVTTFGSRSNIPAGTRYLMLDDVNPSVNRGGLMKYGQDPLDGSTRDSYDGPDAWKNLNNTDPRIRNNTIIEWSGSEWVDLLPEWVMSKIPSSNIVYAQNQLVVYDGVVYRALSNITATDNMLIPADNTEFESIELIFTNLKTGLQYRWAGDQWLKSFEGEYPSGSWRFELDP